MRQPIQVLTYVYRRADCGIEYLLLHRLPGEYCFWQGVSGGVEGNETPIEAAAREVAEETGLDVVKVVDVNYSYTFPPDDDFRVTYNWDVGEIVEHAFAAEISAKAEVRIDPREHDDFRWCSLDEALELLYWPENKEALRRAAMLVSLGDALREIAQNQLARDSSRVKVYVYRWNGRNIEHLLLHRKSDRPEIWHGVRGKIEEGVPDWLARLRIVEEQTGLKNIGVSGYDYSYNTFTYDYLKKPDAVTVERTSETFYFAEVPWYAWININTAKHDDFCWCPFVEALQLLKSAADKEALRRAHECITIKLADGDI